MQSKIYAFSVVKKHGAIVFAPCRYIFYSNFIAVFAR